METGRDGPIGDTKDLGHLRKGEVEAPELTSELVLLGMVRDRVGIIVTREELRKLKTPKKV